LKPRSSPPAPEKRLTTFGAMDRGGAPWPAEAICVREGNGICTSKADIVALFIWRGCRNNRVRVNGSGWFVSRQFLAESLFYFFKAVSLALPDHEGLPT